MNLSTYVRRYMPVFEQAVTSYPAHITFPAAPQQPQTHVVRMRETRTYLKSHPNLLSAPLRHADAFEVLSKLNFWYVEDTVYIGQRSAFSQEDHYLTAGTTANNGTYNIIDKPLTPDQLQALVYCYNAELLSIPSRINNQTPEILTLLDSFSSRCPNAAISIYDTYAIIL